LTRLQAFLMQVFYALKKLIDGMKEPSSLTDKQVTQIIATTESMREQLKDHLKGLIQRSRHQSSANLDTESAPETEALSIDDLQSLIDELLQDS